MEKKAYTCPACGGRLDVEYSAMEAVCPYCDTKVHISYGEEKPAKDPRARQFSDSGTGIPLVSAVVPPEYTLSGSLRDQWLSETVPFTYVIRADSPDKEISLIYTSPERYEDLRNPLFRNMMPRLPNAIPSGFRDFVEVDTYIQQYAMRLLGGPVTAVARTALPSTMGKNLPQARSKMQNDILASLSTDPSFSPQIPNLYCDAILTKFTGNVKGTEVVVLVGCDYMGAEISLFGGFGGGIRNAFGGLQNAFGNLMGGGNEEPQNYWEFFKSGGVFGQMRRGKQRQTQPNARPAGQPDGPIPFGHAKEYGKTVDAIQWGGEFYAVVAPVHREQEATEVFLKFVASIEPDAALVQRWNLMVQQYSDSMNAYAQQNRAMAQQMQMQNMQRQRDLSRTISQNNADFLAGSMDSFYRRDAAQSRMSQNYSEAVRSVNTYTTPTGGRVEASVGADHVYQNQYGDVFGVSGNPLDSETLNQLNWTELHKK